MLATMSRKSRAKKKRLPSNWRKRIEFEVEEEEKCRFHDGSFQIRINFIKGKTPKGFMRYVGTLSVAKCGGKNYVEESDLEDVFQGRGLGKKLYLMALERCGSITTYYHEANQQAQYVWKSLIKKYRYDTDFFKGILTVWNDPKEEQDKT